MEDNTFQGLSQYCASGVNDNTSIPRTVAYLMVYLDPSRYFSHTYGSITICGRKTFPWNRTSEPERENVPPQAGSLSEDNHCPLIKGLHLNPEVEAAIGDAVYKKDQRLTTAASNWCWPNMFGTVLSLVLQEEGGGNRQYIELLNDAGKLLTDIHHTETVARRELFTFNLKNETETVNQNISTFNNSKRAFKRSQSTSLQAGVSPRWTPAPTENRLTSLQAGSFSSTASVNDHKKSR
nr:unnamed protein product [Callosobruchus chinensis]